MYMYVRNQDVSILRVFDTFQFQPLCNSCSIFYYILYIGYDIYLFSNLMVFFYL